MDIESRTTEQKCLCKLVIKQHVIVLVVTIISIHIKFISENTESIVVKLVISNSISNYSTMKAYSYYIYKLLYVSI